MRTLAWLGLAAASLALLPPRLLAGDTGGRAEYVGGTVTGLPSKTEGELSISDPEEFSFRIKTGAIRIPYTRIHTLEYGQQVSRRYVSAVLVSPILLLAKKRRHYLSVGYADEDGRNQAMVFEVDKNHIRPILVGLEARTGRRVEYQDQEARKGGKG